MRPRTLAILAAVVALMLAFIWFVERDLPSSDERARQARQVLSLVADDVEALTIEWGDEVVELRRQPGDAAGEPISEDASDADWRLVRPLEARADGAAVAGLVSRLAELEKVRTLEGVSRADVGLAEPRARVTLESPNGSDVLEIGAEIPASSNMTLAVAGLDPVYVVAGALWATLTKAPGDWRDRQLFPWDRSEIERVAVSNGSTRIEIGRRGEAYWIESPIADRADRDSVDALLAEISRLRAEAFIDGPEAAAALEELDDPVGSLEVVVSGVTSPLPIVIGRQIAAEGEGAAGSTGRHARIGNQVVRLTTELEQSLGRSVAQWRSLDWSTSEVYRIERAVIEDQSGAVEVRREGGDWLRDGEPIGYGLATDLLFEITGAAAELLLDDPRPLGTPELTVTIDSDDGTQEVVELFAATDEGVPARASGRDTVLLLSGETASSVWERLSDLRVAQPEAPADG